jgi:hypothetical protein
MHFLAVVALLALIAWVVVRVRERRRQLYEACLREAWDKALNDPDLSQWIKPRLMKEERWAEEDRQYEEHRQRLIAAARARGEYDD